MPKVLLRPRFLLLAFSLLAVPALAQAGSEAAPKPPPTVASPTPLPTDLVAFFAGEWTGKGAFANGRPIEARLTITPDLQGQWLALRHEDQPPNAYRALSLWGVERASQQLVMTIHDAGGGLRLFTSEGWRDGKVIFDHSTPLPAPPTPPGRQERFTYERLSPVSFRFTYEVRAEEPAGSHAWRLGDSLVFSKVLAALPAPPPGTELPMLPGSDPLVLGAYHWALHHSPSLQDVVRKLVKAERKARYRLVPGLDKNYGRLVVLVTNDEYEVDLQVPILAWNRCGDALEPWIASVVYLALETAGKGRFRETGDPNRFLFERDTMRATFAFQAQVRKELTAADPSRLKDLPDGEQLYSAGFPPTVNASGQAVRRPLPAFP